MKRRWTEEEIWDWYREHEWITGFNFIPSNSMTGSVYYFQSYHHEEAFKDAAKELALAAFLKFNSIRVSLPFDVWRQEHDQFFASMDELLDLLEKYNMTLMPILFSDCCVPKEKYKPKQLGPQPEPVPGYFGGSPVTPFDDSTQSGKTVGYSITDDPAMEPEIRRYVEELAERYGQDSRILIWNIWNEAGNSSRGMTSLPMMKKIFSWMREKDISQPLTADIWGLGSEGGWYQDPTTYAEIELEAIALSDIVTFHYYGDYLHARQLVHSLRQFGRPLINTEWLHRPYRSLIQTQLPLWKREGVGSYFFGFVNGKSQHHIVWEVIKNEPNIDTSLWMHDIFHADFTPYDPEEIEVIRSCNEDRDIWRRNG